MDAVLKQAIQLRKEKAFTQSRNLLEQLLVEADYQALAHLHIAWSFDNQGLEKEAVEHYLLSLKGTLNQADRLDAMFGLASTLRCLGRYEEALDYYELARKEFPESLEFRPFHAMCL